MTPTHTILQAKPSTASTLPAWSLRALLMILFATVLLVRWWQLAELACDHPFWDQWDSEVANLYQPFVNHQLTLSALFTPHNEHRILFTRLWNLAFFIANDQQFDNRVTTLANAGVFAFALCLFARPLLASASLRLRFLLLPVLALAGSLPFGWENLLSGFQNAFYFFFGISALALDRAADADERWYTPLVVIFLALLALFTIASGTLLAPILAAVAVVHWRNGRWPLGRATVFALICMAIAALGFWLTPHVAGHDPLRAQSVSMFLIGVVRNLAWPLESRWAVAVLWLPFAVAAVQALRGAWRDVKGAHIDIYLLAMSAWVLLQAVAMAYSRALPPIVASRYSDLLIVGGICNGLLALRLGKRLKMPYRPVALIASAIAGCVLLSAYAARGKQGMVEARERSDLGRRQQTHLIDYLRGKGLDAWKDVPGLELSYPSAPRLAGLLNDAVVRGMLPASVREPLAVVWPTCPILSHPGVPDSFRNGDRATVRGTFSSDGGATAVGRCVSAPVTTRFPYLSFDVAGSVGSPGLSLQLVAKQTGHSATVMPLTTSSGAIWHRAGSRVPDPLFQLIAEDQNADSWLASAPPVEQGRLSYWASRLAAAFGGSEN
ncbi:MAG: hypothetical protein ABI411_14460 [Tahibacter sp.]